MATAEPSSNTNKEESGNPGEDPSQANANFECNICLDTAKDAVISMCGHLFCWPCLHKWLETRPTNQMCPVCKAAISREKVIPLYGRGSSNQKDPRDKMPPRPQGQRTEPEQQNSFIPGFNFGEGNLQFHFGIGAFPFSSFFTVFNAFNGMMGQNVPQELHAGEAQAPTIIKYLLLVIVFYCYWRVLME